MMAEEFNPCGYMKGKLKLIFVISFFFLVLTGSAQTKNSADTLPELTYQLKNTRKPFDESRIFQIAGVGVPLIIEGVILKSERKHFREVRDEYFPTFHYHYDDYLQYLPVAVMFGMKLGGVQGRSSWGRMLTSDVISLAIMSTTVNLLKSGTGVLRPDGSDRHSFPSGHTATAFMTATMMHKEYGLTRSPWYSVGAYTVATATGISRILNNKHWVSDVMVGAGVGILSTELGYYFGDLLFKNRGLLRDELPGRSITRDFKPSFFGLYLGMDLFTRDNISLGGMPLSISKGGTVGIEGAWFMTPHVGIGGRFTVASMSVSVNHVAEEEPLNMFSGYVGPYFSYPLVPRLLVGTKLLVGYVSSPACNLSFMTIGDSGGVALGTGFSLTYVARQNLGIKLFADYNFQHSILSSGKGMEHQVTLGGAINIMF